MLHGLIPEVGILLMELSVSSYNWSLMSAVEQSVGASMLTGPDVVDRRMARMRSEPPVGGSIDSSKEGVSQCKAHSVLLFPSQRHVYSCSLRDPLEASNISCRAAMSMVSRLSSRSMMAVFLESLICWISFDKPRQLVLIFQFDSRRADIFILFDLPGVMILIHLMS